MLATAAMTNLVQKLAPPPALSPMGSWPMLQLGPLESPQFPVPGGRYTQIRSTPKNAVVLWNANGGKWGRPGLRLTHCLTPDCRLVEQPHTVTALDSNPRFIRMELLAAADGLGLPLLTFGAVNSTELHFVRCSDASCGSLQWLRVMGSAHKVRHPDLLVPRNASRPAYIAATFCSSTACELRIVACNLTTGANVSVTPIDHSAPFAIDHETKLPTGGLENPSLAELDDGSVALAYWHVEARALKLIFDATNNALRKSITVANASGAIGSSPGAWCRIVASDGLRVVLFFFDLPRRELRRAVCAKKTGRCESALVDGDVSLGDVSDFGAGGFPDLRLPPAQFRQRGFAAGPTYVYFSDRATASANATVGELRGVFCNTSSCGGAKGWTRHVLASGAAGFGRDASMAFVLQGALQAPAMLVSFLDLQGEDTPEGMVAKLAVFEG